MQIVIIGAAAAGLYTAIKFIKKGVNIENIVVYDPRAGSYTRPGHLTNHVFRKAEQGINKYFWSGDRQGHIKDLERLLYLEAQHLGIKIEKKQFMRLKPDSKAPGVIVASQKGNGEFIAADYVFDCTGSQRQVVHAVNKISPASPLIITPITEVPVPNHFLAYVKMAESQLYALNKFIADELNMGFGVVIANMDAHYFAQSIVKLREFGWNEFKFPRCYGVPFGKGKVCLYLQTPAGLAKENYDLWVQTVLECYVKPVSYQHLPPSRKYAYKPRFIAFTVTANALQQVSYKGMNLPTVIALGDAQIDADYFLAHGIFNGMTRIDALFEHMKITDGKISYFDPDDYQRKLEVLLRLHKLQITDQAWKVKYAFSHALKPAQAKFLEAASTTTDPHEQAIFSTILKEINARLGLPRPQQPMAFKNTIELSDRAPLLQTNRAALQRYGVFANDQANEEDSPLPSNDEWRCTLL